MKRTTILFLSVILATAVWAQAPVKDALYGSTKAYFTKAQTQSDNMRRMMRDFYYLPEFGNVLKELVPDEVGNAQAKLEYCYMRDIYNIMHQMGYDPTKIRTLEGLPVMLLMFESYSVPDQKEHVLNFDNVHRTRDYSA